MIDPNRYAEACHQNDKLTKENATLREAVKRLREAIFRIPRHCQEILLADTAKYVKEGE